MGRCSSWGNWHYCCSICLTQLANRALQWPALNIPQGCFVSGGGGGGGGCKPQYRPTSCPLHPFFPPPLCRLLSLSIIPLSFCDSSDVAAGDARTHAHTHTRLYGLKPARMPMVKHIKRAPKSRQRFLGCCCWIFIPSCGYLRLFQVSSLSHFPSCSTS